MKLLPRVMHGFDSANSPYGLRNHQQTAFTGDAWIRQHKQHLRTLKSSTKLLPRVTHVFDSAKSPFGIKKIINEN
jgi:hypothetical protein